MKPRNIVQTGYRGNCVLSISWRTHNYSTQGALLTFIIVTCVNLLNKSQVNLKYLFELFYPVSLSFIYLTGSSFPLKVKTYLLGFYLSQHQHALLSQRLVMYFS